MLIEKSGIQNCININYTCETIYNIDAYMYVRIYNIEKNTKP